MRNLLKALGISIFAISSFAAPLVGGHAAAGNVRPVAALASVVQHVRAPAQGQDYKSLCVLIVRVSSEMGLRQYSDRQVRNGLCMMTKASAETIATNSPYRSYCTQAAAEMMREFIRRFGGEDPKSVIGRC